MTLQADSVGVRIRERSVLAELSFSVNPGETLVVTGESGAGKTTLLRTLAGLQAPCDGRISYSGILWNSPSITVPADRRSIGMVFQELALWPHLTVAAQIEITLRGLAREQRRHRCIEVMEALQLTEVAERLPMQLSGGQRQRAAVGRALARRPAVALLDEPTNQLDPEMARHVIGWLKKEQREAGRILVVVTHDISCHSLFAEESARICRLQAGRLQPIGSGD